VNAPAAPGASAGRTASPGQATRPAAVRRRRAVIARRLQAGAPAIAVRLDWKALDAAPGWLTLPAPDLMRFARRIGAVRGIPSIRLWIDAPRVGAAKEAIGARFLQSLLALPESRMPLPQDMAQEPEMDTADQVSPVLQATGLAVLLASLPAGDLRDTGAAIWAPARPADMPTPVAQMLVSRVRALSVNADASAAGDARPTRPQREST
jgi:hypothetical protein